VQAFSVDANIVTNKRNRLEANTVRLLILTKVWLELVDSVLYGVGRGGFSLGRPRLISSPGGIFVGLCRLAPVRGPLPLIPWTGPVIDQQILTGTRLGGGCSGARAGKGPRKANIYALPWAIRQGGAGKMARGPRFSGTRRPCNELDSWM